MKAKLTATRFYLHLFTFLLLASPALAEGTFTFTSSGKIVPRSTLSLVVSASDTKALEQSLRKFSRTVKLKHVKPGQVCVVGSFEQFRNGLNPAAAEPRVQKLLNQLTNRGGANTKGDGQAKLTQNSINEAALGSPFDSRLFNELKKAGLPDYEATPAEHILQRLKVTYSPSWVVRHLGRDYVYEGLTDPFNLFDKQGIFIGGAANGQ